ncbi:MAG: bifunctional diaminohydroxyphosphoribosylaminopyrimidine deaminase/5-amino-6-(5-phosphoribosylamino)uracil reductase RibD [Acidobacteriota bacterium]
MSHLKFMRRALALARRGYGQTSPNPMVGAVLVRDGAVVGEGYHLYKRCHHAEALALDQAGERARGATLYVNLEPCSHQGRTPPCAALLIQAGIRRAFVSLRDPNPLVAGRGLQRMKDAAIEIQEGLCRDQAERLNEAFLHFIHTGRPFAILKLAMTLDGRIATRQGDSKWITAPQARRRVHRLRYGCDAVLVGAETILQDNPSLNVRWTRRNPIAKAVLDSRLRTPPNARIFDSRDPVWLFHAENAPSAPRKAYPSGSELIPVSHDGQWLDWREILEELGKRRCLSLMIEGGRQVAASALQSGLVQKVEFHYGPRIIGADGLPAIGEMGFDRLQDCLQLERLSTRRIGCDFAVEGYLAEQKAGKH